MGCEPPVVLEVVEVVTHQVGNNTVLFQQLLFQIVNSTLKGLDLFKPQSLHDHHVVHTVYPILSLSKSNQLMLINRIYNLAYHHLDICHQVVQTSTNDTNQLMTGVYRC